MDIANSDLEKDIKHNIKNNKYVNDLDFYKLLKECINVLIDLKILNLYHMNIKPVNILIA